MKKRIAVSVVGAWSLLAVASHYATAESADGINAEASAPGKKQIVPPLRAEAAPRPSPRQDAPTQKELPMLIARYFEGNVGRRLYIQVDKPLYKPGETIWFKTWDLKARALNGADTSQTTVELVSPKGRRWSNRGIPPPAGTPASVLIWPPGVRGG